MASVIQEGVSLSKFWKIVKAREAWRAAVHGVQSWTWLSNWTTTWLVSAISLAHTTCPPVLFLGTLRSAEAVLRGLHHKRSAPGRSTQSSHFSVSGHLTQEHLRVTFSDRASWKAGKPSSLCTEKWGQETHFCPRSSGYRGWCRGHCRGAVLHRSGRTPSAARSAGRSCSSSHTPRTGCCPLRTGRGTAALCERDVSSENSWQKVLSSNNSWE